MRETVTLSVVAPAYNEQESLAAFVERTDAVLRELPVDSELIVVNDGSRDRTLDIALELTRRYPRLKVVNLARNFGHEMASTAGIAQARGDAVVLIDADLQDPPELIPELYAQWKEGFDVVYAQRRKRDGEGVFKTVTSWTFYRFTRWMTGLELPVDTGDYRLLDRKVVDAFNRMGERHRFVRGMIAWLGFKQTGVQFDRDRRFAGSTKYNVFKLAALALDSLIGFTTRPLRLATQVGLALFLFGMGGFFYVFVQKLFPVIGEYIPWMGIQQSGYALLMCSLFLIGGLQSFLMGIIGEYLGRIYQQVQGRPLFLVEGVYQHTAVAEARAARTGAREAVANNT